MGCHARLSLPPAQLALLSCLGVLQFGFLLTAYAAVGVLPTDSVLGPYLEAYLAHNSKRHPPCTAAKPLTRLPYDVHEFLWRAPTQGVPEGDPTLTEDLSTECVENPAIVWLHADVFVLVAKVMQRGQLQHDHGRKWVKVAPLVPSARRRATSRCSVFSHTGPWHGQLWHNNPDFLVLAVLRLDLQTGAPRELLARRVIKKTWEHPHGFIFDARAFRSDTGSLLIEQFVTNVAGRKEELRIIEISVSKGANGNYTIELQPFRTFYYRHVQFEDKNWVPWHGTTRISYPHYPGFEPHTVLDVGSYRQSGNITDPVSSVPVPVIAAIRRYYEAEEVSFRGGTPAIAFPGRGRGGASEYLAVGHLVANSQCFHHFPETEAPQSRARGVGAPYCPTNYVAMRSGHGCSRNGKPVHRSPFSAYVPMHHFEDYFMFFYTFAAAPPHNITRLSDALIPMHPGQPHAGVYFPTGLDALGPTSPAAPAERYVLSYGTNDDTGNLLMLTRQEIESYLRPIEEVKPETYGFCSMYSREGLPTGGGHV